jgi:UDP-N-acetylmuramate--alanine ligase
MKPSIRLSRLHFIGIGGSGMSVLAEVLLAWGFRVSGSDGQASPALEHLKTLGMRVETGHRPENVGEADVVVYSSAVPQDNPELAEARRRGIPAIKRAEMLGEALRGKYPLAVSGTHGKTTTTTMLGRIWLQAGKDPTLLAGGTARGENLSAVAGQGQVLIVEADEFDRSFLAMRPACAIIGNIDSDHLDCYGTLDAVREAFIAFAESLPFYGLVVANRDDAGVQAILPRLSRRVATYGLSADAEYRAVDIRVHGPGMTFTLERKGAKLGNLSLQVPGIHNVYNALGAAALSLEEGLTFKQVEQGLREYPGVKRRLEFRGEKSGVKFYDDYAHHPTEVAAALQAARGLITPLPDGTGRLIAVFQPHLYSRTQQLYPEFARAFSACDELFVTRVYAAREKPIAGVEGDLIAAEARNGSLPADKVHYVTDLDSLPRLVADKLRAGDLVVTMGAGDIGQRGAGIQEALP